ncbi:MAG: hypothetical protein ABW110_20980, partial [Steroidobacteraceae bacterium]
LTRLEVLQNIWVVPDLESAVQYRTELHGGEPRMRSMVMEQKRPITKRPVHISPRWRNVLLEGEDRKMRFAYVDTRSTLGFMLQVIEDSAHLRAVIKRFTATSAAWDGHHEGASIPSIRWPEEAS